MILVNWAEWLSWVECPPLDLELWVRSLAGSYIRLPRTDTGCSFAWCFVLEGRFRNASYLYTAVCKLISIKYFKTKLI